MGRQLIDTIAPGETIQSGGNKINEMTLELYRAGSAGHTFHVSKEGSDSNDGKSWGAAKLTVAGAIAAMPDDGGGRHLGHLKVGRGVFTETTGTPFVVGNGFFLEGQGGGSSSAIPSRIVLGTNRNTHLFECTNLTSQNHGMVFKDIELMANAQSAGPSSLLKYAGGYNCYLLNVYFIGARDWGLHVGGGYLNIHMYNVTGASCGSASQGGWMFFEGTQSAGIVSIFGAQVDACGVYPIFVQYTGDGGGPTFHFTDMKFEQQSGNSALHANAIRFSPRLTGVGNPIYFTIENCFFYNNSASTNEHEAAIYEMNHGAGYAADWDIRSVTVGPQYQRVFKSVYTLRQSFGRKVFHLMDQLINWGPTGYPLVELRGAQVWVGTGAPPDTVGVPGSLGLRTDGSGGTNTNLYVFKGTGWVGIA